MRRLNQPSHLDLCCLQKPIIIACGSERVKYTGRISVISQFIGEVPSSRSSNWRNAISSVPEKKECAKNRILKDIIRDTANIQPTLER